MRISSNSLAALDLTLWLITRAVDGSPVNNDLANSPAYSRGMCAGSGEGLRYVQPTVFVTSEGCDEVTTVQLEGDSDLL